MSAASPGVIATFLPNEYYPSHEKYIEAMARVMRDEYKAIDAAASCCSSTARTSR